MKDGSSSSNAEKKPLPMGMNIDRTWENNMKIQIITLDSVAGAEPIVIDTSRAMAVRFFPEDDQPEKWIDIGVRAKKDGINIMASRSIEIMPRSSNVAIIRVERG